MIRCSLGVKQFCLCCLVTKEKKKNGEKQNFEAGKMNNKIYTNGIRILAPLPW